VLEKHLSNTKAQNIDIGFLRIKENHHRNKISYLETNKIRYLIKRKQLNKTQNIIKALLSSCR